MLEKIERDIGIESGDSTDDGRFSLETVNCVGACALGPIVVVDGDYAGQMLALVLGSDAFDWQAARPADWRQRPPGWPQTRYEQKAIREGRPCYFLSFVRTGS